MKRAIVSPPVRRFFGRKWGILTDFAQTPMSETPQFDRDRIERYLVRVLGKDVRVTNLRRLGDPEEGKAFGYGAPIRVDYETADRLESAVLHTMGPGSFGHEN